MSYLKDLHPPRAGDILRVYMYVEDELGAPVLCSSMMVFVNLRYCMLSLSNSSFINTHNLSDITVNLIVSVTVPYWMFSVTRVKDPESRFLT